MVQKTQAERIKELVEKVEQLDKRLSRLDKLHVITGTVLPYHEEVEIPAGSDTS